MDKTLLARAINAWNQLPHIVSRGGQKNFVQFMEGLRARGDSWEPDSEYYRTLIGKVIVFKNAERIARQIGFSAYRANAVCYTVSLLAYRTAGRVDLESIWNAQEISENMRQTIHNWMPAVHEEIVHSAGSRNVTEWCKKKECWTHIQTLRKEFASGLENELTQGLPMPTVGKFKNAKGGRLPALTFEELERQARTMRFDSKEWLEIIEWARESGKVNDFQMKLAGTVLGYAVGGWNQVPSPKQTRHMADILDLWEGSGVSDRE